MRPTFPPQAIDMHAIYDLAHRTGFAMIGLPVFMRI